MSWSGLPLDLSFRDQMIPVETASDAGKVIYVSRYDVTVWFWLQC